MAIDFTVVLIFGIPLVATCVILAVELRRRQKRNLDLTYGFDLTRSLQEKQIQVAWTLHAEIKELVTMLQASDLSAEGRRVLDVHEMILKMLTDQVYYQPPQSLADFHVTLRALLNTARTLREKCENPHDGES